VGEDPFFKGPGILAGEVDGDLEFRVFDQVSQSKGRANHVFRAIITQEQMRLFATDLSGTRWTSRWFIPSVRSSESGQSVISGRFQRLSTRAELSCGENPHNSTALYYAEKLPLPMRESTTTQTTRDGQIRFEPFMFSVRYT
jgi:hypothetical protein